MSSNGHSFEETRGHHFDATPKVEHCHNVVEDPAGSGSGSAPVTDEQAGSKRYTHDALWQGAKATSRKTCEELMDDALSKTRMSLSPLTVKTGRYLGAVLISGQNLMSRQTQERLSQSCLRRYALTL